MRAEARSNRVRISVVGAVAAIAAALIWSHLAYAPKLEASAGGAVVRQIVWWAVLVCLVYLLVVYALYGVQLLFAGADSLLRNRERRAEDFETIERSRFTIPVTCVVAAHNEEPIVVAAVRSLLDQNYPELEVIVVDDGSVDATFERLRKTFDLQPEEIYFRKIFETSEILDVHRSHTDERLVVVRKANGGKADALNCAVNFARYPYVAGIDGDTVCEPEALAKGMRLVLRDPATVIGVTSHVAISYRPEEASRFEAGRRAVDSSLFSNFQHIDYMRSFLNNRLAWSRLGFMLCTVGAFNLWRRDVLEEVGGFSRDFSCEDIELTFRVHEKYLREQRPYKILSLPDTVATTEGPNRVTTLIKQRARWQRVIMETVWHYRRLLGNPRYKTVGLIGVPFYVVTEVLAPLFELLSMAVLVSALWFDLLNWVEVASVLGIMALVSAILTATAVLIEDATTRNYRLRDLGRLLALGPLDLFAYRPILMVARTKGAWDFLRKRRDWDSFDRNRRLDARVAAPSTP